MKETKIKIEGLNCYYQQKIVLKGCKGEFEENAITTIIGPSGVGKTTFLMVLNRLYELIPNCRVEGKVEFKLNGRYLDIHNLPLAVLRKKMGMVFQAPNPLPMSIFKNVAFPLRLSGIKDRKYLEEKVKKVLKDAILWDEVKDRLEDSALRLSGGQQQRMCIARAMITQPDVLLLDEPTSSLDIEAALKIEELLLGLKERCTLIIVSHYADLTRRISDSVITLKDGRFRKHPNSSQSETSGRSYFERSD
jgi:phosphate transport system ATP-binding protein